MPDADDIIAHVTRLETSSDWQALRAANLNYGALTHMEMPSELGQDWLDSVGGAYDEPSPFVLHLAQVLANDRLAYKTRIKVVPKHNQRLKGAADEVEKGLSILRARMDDGKRVSSDTILRQLTATHAIWITHFDPEDECPAWVEVPDIFSCFFEIPPGGGPARLPIMGRRWLQPIRSASEAYSDKGPMAGKKLVQNDTGEWGTIDFIGEDRARDSGSEGTFAGGGDSLWRMGEFVSLYDGSHYCHVAVNGLVDESGNRQGPGKNGIIVEEGESLCGRSPCLLITGTVFPDRQPARRLQPILHPEFQELMLYNDTRSMLSTRAHKLRQDIITSRSPEVLQAAEAAGTTGQVPELQRSGDGANAFQLDADVTLVPLQVDPNLVEKLQHHKDELLRYAGSRRVTSDPELLSVEAVNVYLANSEAVHRQEGRPMQYLDWAWRESLVDTCRAIIVMDDENVDEWPMWSVGGEHKGLASGDTVTLNREMLVKGAPSGKIDAATEDDDTAEEEKSEDLDKMLSWLIVLVETYGKTPADERAEFQLHLLKEQMGYATKLEGIAIFHEDEADWLEEHARDTGVKYVNSLIGPQIAADLTEELRLTSGVLAFFGQPPAPGAATGQPPAPVDAATQGREPMPVPMTGQARGGSAA